MNKKVKVHMNLGVEDLIYDSYGNGYSNEEGENEIKKIIEKLKDVYTSTKLNEPYVYSLELKDGSNVNVYFDKCELKDFTLVNISTKNEDIDIASYCIGEL